MTNVNLTTNLSALLEREGLTEERVVEYDLPYSRRLWETYRIANGMAGHPPLLTHPDAQHKLGLSSAYTVGLTLQSADGSGVETCPWRGQCASVCVLKNGNGAYPKVQRARDLKTRFLKAHPDAFLRLLVDELDTLCEKALSGRTLRCRLNVNSDLRWYRIVPWLFKRYEAFFAFYDYTKNPAILSNEDGGLVFGNYLLVPSIGENTNLVKAYEFLSHGGMVAVVTNRKKGQPVRPDVVIDGLFGNIFMPWEPWVVDGDKTDDLWSHPEGAVIDLTAKGKARTMTELGFVRKVY